jgi:hypothetical protein
MPDKHNNQKLIMESFRDWSETTEEVEPLSEYFDSDGNLVEEEFEPVLNEAVFSLGLMALGKLMVILFKLLSQKKELEQLNTDVQKSGMPDAAKEVSAKAMELLDVVEKNSGALEKAAEVAGAGGNLNPLNWKGNALIALARKMLPKADGSEEPDDPSKPKITKRDKAPRPVVVKQLKE